MALDKVQVCFICLKQLKTANSAEEDKSKNFFFSSSCSATSKILYSQFDNFVRKYLKVRVEHDYEDKNEMVEFCEPCSSRVSLVCELYKELCSVELKLSSKLEELRRLIKDTELDEVLLATSITKSKKLGGNLDELRNSISEKCIQKCEQVSTHKDLADNLNPQKSTDDHADDIKVEVESIPSDDEEHGMVKLYLESGNISGQDGDRFKEGEEQLDSFIPRPDSFCDGAEHDNDYVSDHVHPQVAEIDPLEIPERKPRKRRRMKESDEGSDSDNSFQAQSADEDSDSFNSDSEAESLEEMDSEEEVELVKTLRSSSRRKTATIRIKTKDISSIKTTRKSTHLPVTTSFKHAIKKLEVDSSCLCTICGKICETVTKLYKHLEYHEEKSKKKSLHCTFCEKIFTYEQTKSLHTQRNHKRASASSISFTCDDNRCQASFDSQAELNSHLETHSKPLHNCSSCEARFIHPENLQLHEILHIKRERVEGKDMLFPCPFPSCTTKMYYIKDLQYHYNNCHGSCFAIYNCLMCNLSFSSETYLSSHQKKHEESSTPDQIIDEPPNTLAPPPCTECGLQFLRLKCMDKHRRNVHNLGVECPVCHKMLGKRDDIWSHVKHMHKPKPKDYIPKKTGRPRTTKYFPCGHCEQVFNDRGTRKAHWKADHPPRKMKEIKCVCEDCGKSFRFLSAVSRHRNYRHGSDANIGKRKQEKSFICHTCGRGYSKQKCLEKHEQEHFSGKVEEPKEKKIFDCHLCSQKYMSRQRLKHHLRSVHQKKKGEEITQGEGPPKPCNCMFPSCQQVYFEEEELKKHVKQAHSKTDDEAEDDNQRFMCDLCGRVFQNAQGLKRHTVTHDEKQRTSCPVCHKTFSLEYTVKEHLIAVHGVGKEKEEEWVCTQPNCGRKFSSKKYLGNHERTVHRYFRRRSEKKKPKANKEPKVVVKEDMSDSD